MLALTGCDTEAARVILDGLRGRLDAAITVAGLPKFTVSFGVVEAFDNEDLPALISRRPGLVGNKGARPSDREIPRGR